MITVNIPRIGSVNFPDDMPHEDIVNAIQSEIIPAYETHLEKTGFVNASIGGIKRGLGSTNEASAQVLDSAGYPDIASGRRKAAEEYLAEAQQTHEATTGSDVAAAWDQGVIPGAMKWATKNITEPAGNILGRFGPPTVAGMAAAAAAPEMAGGALAARTLGFMAADVPAEMGENIEAAQDAGTAVPGITKNVLGGIVESVLGSVGIPLTSKLSGVVLRKAEALLPRVISGELTKEAAIKELGMFANIVKETAANATANAATMTAISATRRGLTDQEVLSPEAMEQYGEGAKTAAILSPFFGAAHGRSNVLAAREAIEGAPVGEAPVGEAPVGGAPVGGAPVGGAPVGGAPNLNPEEHGPISESDLADFISSVDEQRFDPANPNDAYMAKVVEIQHPEVFEAYKDSLPPVEEVPVEEVPEPSIRGAAAPDSDTLTHAELVSAGIKPRTKAYKELLGMGMSTHENISHADHLAQTNQTGNFNSDSWSDIVSGYREKAKQREETAEQTAEPSPFIEPNDAAWDEHIAKQREETAQPEPMLNDAEWEEHITKQREQGEDKGSINIGGRTATYIKTGDLKGTPLYTLKYPMPDNTVGERTDVTMADITEMIKKMIKPSIATSDENTAHTIETLTPYFTPQMRALVKSGKLTLHDSLDTFPGENHPEGVQGLTTPQGEVHLLANKLTPESIPRVVLHEMGVHVGMKGMVGDKVWGDLTSQALTTKGGAFEAARRSVPEDTPEHLKGEETLAYLVENAPHLPIVKRTVAAIKNWARTTFGARLSITEADIHHLATKALRKESQTSARSVRLDSSTNKKGDINGQFHTGTNQGEFPGSRNLRGSAGVLAESSGQTTGYEGRDSDGSLSGLPRNIKGFNPSHFQPAEQITAAYMKTAGLPYNPPAKYVKVDIERAKRIADAYEAMPHEPQNPEVKAAYAQMIKETVAQYKAMLSSGITVEFAPRGVDPYHSSPREMTEDVRSNNHMWVFGTRDGFGSDVTFDPIENPMLAETDVEISGQKALANDLFRAVHDYFGHVKEGVGFRADGEENAWQAHMSMFSPLAGRALSTETRGQNSWLNYGPHGDMNRLAKTKDTLFADQKVGMLPEWVSAEGREFSKKSEYVYSIANKLKAPNGKPSNLNAMQHAQVRTPEFKAWFGDWGNDAENASKVVDENGEPLVTYRGYGEENPDVNKEFTWVSEDKKLASGYAENRTSPTISSVFVKLNTPFNLDHDNRRISPTEFVSEAIKSAPNKLDKDKILNTRVEFLDYFKSMYRDQNAVRGVSEYWGKDQAKVVIKELLTALGYDGIQIVERTNVSSKFPAAITWAAFNPNQIKSATGNTGAFDKKNNDIRYSIHKDPLVNDLFKAENRTTKVEHPASVRESIAATVKKYMPTRISMIDPTDRLGAKLRNEDTYNLVSKELRGDQLQRQIKQMGEVVRSVLVLGKPQLHSDGTVGAKTDGRLSFFKIHGRAVDFGTKHGFDGPQFIDEVARVEMGRETIKEDKVLNAYGKKLQDLADAHTQTAKDMSAKGKVKASDIKFELDKAKQLGAKSKEYLAINRERVVKQEHIDRIEKLVAKYPESKTILKDLRDFNRSLVDLARDSGLIDADKAKKWNAPEHYIPMYKPEDLEALENEHSSWGVGVGAKTAKNAADYRREGHTHKINVWDNVQQHAGFMVSSSAQNKARSIAVRQLAMYGEASKAKDQSRSSKDGNLAVYENGIKHWYVVKDPDALIAFQTFNYAARPLMQMAGSVLRVGALYNPVYWYRQLVRDPLAANFVANLGGMPITPLHTLYHFAAILTNKSKGYKVLKERGVVSSVDMLKNYNSMESVIGKPVKYTNTSADKVRGLLSHIHEASDAATRVAILIQRTMLCIELESLLTSLCTGCQKTSTILGRALLSSLHQLMG